MAKKKNTLETSLLKESEAVIFNEYKSQSQELAQLFLYSEVATKEQFEDMCIRLKKLKMFLDEVKDAADKMIEPHQKQIDMIETARKTITKPLSDVDALIRAKLLAFKQTEVTAAREKANLFLVEIDEKFASYISILRRLRCIKENILARLFGGEYEIFNSGEKKYVDTKASTIEMVQTVKNTLVTKFPAEEEFEGLSSRAMEMKDHLINLCETMIEIFQKGGVISYDEETAFKQEAETFYTNAIFWVETAKAAKIAEANAIVKDAKGRNIRSVWKYEVVDVTAVPEIYTVNEVNKTAIRDFMTNHAEMFDAGQQPIPGIRFFKDDCFVNA